MDNRGSRPVVIGQIVFRSWEHEWVTGDRYASSVSAASRLEDHAVQYLPIGHYCPTWDDNLRRRRLLLSGGPKTKGGKFGTTIEVPLAERRLCDC
jgi:hypothetical protein